MTVYAVQGQSRSRYEIVLGAGRDLKVASTRTTPVTRDGGGDADRRQRARHARAKACCPRGADLLSDPLLAAQEVSTLLQPALPKGRARSAKTTPVRVAGSRFIVARTPVMSSYYGPPWNVEGTISPSANTRTRSTSRSRSASPRRTARSRAREHVHRYSGRASYPAKRPRIADNTSLAGWTFDLPNAQDLRFATLGEARRALGVAPPPR